eukprot:scaffold388_cov380-Prasinococcus_capsulatus_cf.AAC.44
MIALFAISAIYVIARSTDRNDFRAASHREEWIIRALQRADFPAATGAIGDNEKQLFCEVALRKPPLSKPRFQAMISDFASICRKECTVDALVAYQF